MSETGPMYGHDCDSCEFLGHFENHDLYYCTGDVPVGPTVIARWSEDGPDYTSGLAYACSSTLSEINSVGAEASAGHRQLRVAYLIAKDLGRNMGKC